MGDERLAEMEVLYQMTHAEFFGAQTPADVQPGRICERP
jgi:hypothetical protein